MKGARLIAVIASVAMALSSFGALACTRFLYQTETNNYHRRSVHGLGGRPGHGPLVVPEGP